MSGPDAIPGLATERLTLSPPRPADREAITTLLGDFEVACWLGPVPHPYALADADHFIAAIAPTHLCLAIRTEPDAPAIGMVGISGVGSGWMLGYWLGRSYWGRGYATEAGRAVMAHVAALAPRPRLVSGYWDGNLRSAGVLSKLGFVVTGQSRAMCRSRGHEVDRVDMVYGPDLT